MEMALSSDLVQRRARETFELFELGLEMKRAQLRRTHPDAVEDEIEIFLRHWLLRRPGSQFGDAIPEGFRLRPIDP